MKYRGYTISPSGMNYAIQKPNGERLCAEVPASVRTAKQWVDRDIAETLAAQRRKAAGGNGSRLT